MANVKNRKSNVAKKAVAAPAQTKQETEVKAADTKVAETKEADTKAAEVKQEETKVPETKAAETETAEAKGAAVKKATVKKTVKKPVKKAEPVQEVYVEYNSEQILTEGLVERIKEQYRSEGHRVGAIKSLRVYINLEHRKAYYVINEKHEENKFIEF